MKQFEKVRMKKPQTSLFDLSHERKFTMDMGKLVPCFFSEVIPGDKFRVNMESLLRFQPMLAPIMHRVNVYTHFFFVPYRLIWSDFQDFMTGGRDGDLEPNFPKFTGNSDDAKVVAGIHSLADYLGIPSDRLTSFVSQDMVPISQLPFRAYQLIYNQYYRDQNLSTEIPIPLDSFDLDWATDSAVELTKLRQRAWEKDYFTSALPWAQRGDQVTLPIASNNVVGDPRIWSDALGMYIASSDLKTTAAGNLSYGAGSDPAKIKGLTTEAVSTTINDLRRSFALQRWLEKAARGGARYIEQVQSFFGVKSSDARLQRAEYLGGGKIPVKIGEVIQTSQTDTTPQGNMAGHGYSAGISNGFSRFFEEHGFVIGIMSVLPRTAYQQGVPKIFSKFDRFDYFFPDFAHIGEQPIKQQEIYLDAFLANNDFTFGYQPRYEEYRYMFDSVHGELRDSLDFWHMGRKFDAQPALNEDFVMSDPTTRIFAVESPDYNKLIVQTYCNFRAIRRIPKFGDPV